MPWWLPAGLALAVVAAVVGGALAALGVAAPGLDLAGNLGDAYLWRVVWFTVFQAALSTLLSVALAVPVARALARRRFPGRGLLLRLFSLSLVIPVIVAIFGIAAVHGRSGWLNDAFELLGLERVHYLYGLTGILIGHCFFNMPFIARILLQAVEAVPPETWRVASQYGLRSGDIFRLVEWPAMRSVLPGAAGLVFMLCFTSFAVVLTLGGGPKATTLEVAVYQALRFDFDLGRAVALALVQLLLCGAIVLAVLQLAVPGSLTLTEGRVFERPDRGEDIAHCDICPMRRACRARRRRRRHRDYPRPGGAAAGRRRGGRLQPYGHGGAGPLDPVARGRPVAGDRAFGRHLGAVAR